MRQIRIAAVAVFCIAFAESQTFEVVSVKPNKIGNAGGEGSNRETIQASPGTLTMRNVTLITSLRWAYGVRDFQISGPSWMGTERYDISAKAAGAASEEQMRTMLQAALAERFKMALHRESKELPVYALVTSKKGMKLTPSAVDSPGHMSPEGGDLVFQNFSMEELADRLSTIPFKVDRPVVNETGLTGRFDFHLKFASSSAELKTALEGMDRGVAVFSYFQEQLGLRLEGRKAAMELLVIDHAEKVPVEN
jgi:uncharacterized protein (TIGR03435 family)